MKLLNAALIAAGTLLASAAVAETQTYSTITNSGGFTHRQSSRLTSATTIVNENVNDTHAGITFAVSASIQTTTTIVQMLKDGTVISSTNVTPSNSQVIVNIAGPVNFQKFKVSPSTTMGTGTADINIIQSR